MKPAEKKQTLSLLDKLRGNGAPEGGYSDKWTDEEMPADEEERQSLFDEDRKKRRLENEKKKLMSGSGVFGAASEALGTMPGENTKLGMGPATGPESGMVPYSPEEFDRRSRFTPQEDAPDGRKRPPKRKTDESDDLADESAPVVGGY